MPKFTITAVAALICCFSLIPITLCSIETPECELPPNVENGLLVVNGDAYDFSAIPSNSSGSIPVPLGTTLTIKCLDGFEIANNSTKSSICTENNSWDPLVQNLGSCSPLNAVECMLPRSDGRGTWSINGEPYGPQDEEIPLPVGTIVARQCNTNLRVVSICQLGGSWNASLNNCGAASEADECSLSPFENGFFIINQERYDGFTNIPIPAGTIIEVRCNNNESRQNISCSADGTWNADFIPCPATVRKSEQSQEPIATAREDCQLPQIDNGFFLINGEPYDVDHEVPLPEETVITLRCDAGFQRVPGDTRPTSTCQADGSWSPQTGYCQRRPTQAPIPSPVPAEVEGCQLPREIANNGQMLVNGDRYDVSVGWAIPVPVGTVITAVCPRRYSMPASSCSSDGNWQPPIEGCQRDEAETPTSTTKGPYVECLLPYDIEDGDVRVNGEIYDQLVDDVDIYLPAGSKVTITCDKDFQINGSDASVCDMTGFFQPQLGRCVPAPKKCTVPLIQNAIYILNGEETEVSGPLSVPQGAQLRIGCNQGFTFADDTTWARTTCQKTGIWDKFVSQCNPTQRSTTLPTSTAASGCPLPNMANARLLVNGQPYLPAKKFPMFVFETELQIICIKPYRLVYADGTVARNSDPLRTTSVCRRSGRWKPEVGQCLLLERLAVTMKPGQYVMPALQQRVINKRLLAAAESGNMTRVRNLIEIGALIEVRDSGNSDATPLILAVINGHDNIAKYLIEKGAKIEARDANSRTALLWAAYVGREDLVRVLLRRDANFEVRDSQNYTALLYAARFGHLEVVKALLDRGSDIEARDASGYTALILAARFGHTELVRFLLDRGSQIDVRERAYGGSALIWAAVQGNSEIVSMLLARGARVRQKASRGLWLGSDALQLAAENITSLLRTQESNDAEDQEEQNQRGRMRSNATSEASLTSALIKAAANDQLDVLRNLLDSGVAVNGRDSNGYTALISAASNGAQSAIRLLLQRGASVGAKDSAGYTALIWAAGNGYASSVRALLEHGDYADVVDAREDTFGGTALMWASFNGHMIVVRYLVQRGRASIDLRAPSGTYWAGHTALMLAAKNERHSVVRFLLESGASRSGCFYPACIAA